jgi:hypothetical protein
VAARNDCYLRIKGKSIAKELGMVGTGLKTRKPIVFLVLNPNPTLPSATTTRIENPVSKEAGKSRGRVRKLSTKTSFIKTTYDISLDSQISLLPLGFSLLGHKINH